MAFQLLAFLPLIAQGAGAAMQGQAGARDAALLKLQGRVARTAADRDSESVMRDYRQLAGRQAAVIAESGGSAEGSFAKILAQSETLANLDRLTTIHRGELRRKGLTLDADTARSRASILAGTQALSAIGGAMGGGRQMPRGY
jgi:hypothetical protein